MRTVTFSDEKIARLVNENFVATWTNPNPKFHNCEKGTERKIATHKGEVFATRNLGTYVLDPSGNILHYFFGYFAPAYYARELEFSLNVLRETRDDLGQIRRDASVRYVALHSARKREREAEIQQLLRSPLQVPKDFRQEMEAIVSAFPDPETEKSSTVGVFGGGGLNLADRLSRIAGSDKAMLSSRREHLLEGLRHLVAVHRTLVSHGQQRSPSLPQMRQVRARHVGANPFAEE